MRCLLCQTIHASCLVGHIEVLQRAGQNDVEASRGAYLYYVEWKARYAQTDVQQKPTNFAPTILLTIKEGARDPPVRFPS